MGVKNVLRSGPQLRPGQKGDHKACLGIAAGLPRYFNSTGLRRLRKDLRSHHLWVVEQQGHLIGFATARGLSREGAEVTWIAVRASQRRKGWGSRLLRVVVRDLAREGRRSLLLWTLARESGYRSYGGTRRFFEAQGFLPIATVRQLQGWEPGNPAVLYFRRLRRAVPVRRRPR